MKHIATRFRLGSAVLLLCLMAPGAFADQVVMSIGWGLGGVGDIYSPYPGHITKINGASTSSYVNVVCLDYHLSTYVNTEYTYNTTSNSGPLLSPPIGGAQQANYDLAARLAAQLFIPGITLDQRKALNWAVWWEFDSSVPVPDKYKKGVGDLIDLYSSGPAPSYTVFTPVNAPPLRSQRYISISVPEPFAVAQLGLYLSSVFGMAIALRRRIARG